MEDAQLVALIASGDRSAGEKLIARHHERLVRYFRRRAGDDAEELIQETCLRLLAAIRRTSIEDLERYLFGIARCVFYKYLKSEGRRRQNISFSESDDGDSEEERAAAAVQRATSARHGNARCGEYLCSCEACLSDARRAIQACTTRRDRELLAALHEGCTVGEVGERFGYDKAAIIRRHRRLLERIRTSVRDGWQGEPVGVAEELAVLRREAEERLAAARRTALLERLAQRRREAEERLAVAASALATRTEAEEGFLKRIERQAILHTVVQAKGNQREAARLLGISIPALRRRLKALGLA